MLLVIQALLPPYQDVEGKRHSQHVHTTIFKENNYITETIIRLKFITILQYDTFVPYREIHVLPGTPCSPVHSRRLQRGFLPQ